MGGLAPVQVESDPEPTHALRHGKQLRLLVALELLEDAGDLAVHQRIEERLALLRRGAGHQLLHQVLDVGLVGHGGQSSTVNLTDTH